mgnify:CR=1 FL=1
MTRTIELIFDFVSPNAYLVWQPLRALAARQGAQIKITPAFLEIGRASCRERV